MAESRIEELEAALATKDAEIDRLKAAGLRDNVQRLWDLVRFKRHELFTEDEIISPDELAALVQDHPAVARLETNDALRREVAALRAQLGTERARFDWWFGPAAKDINEYLRGVREGWSIEQWRAWIDAAKGTEEGREQR